MTRSVRLALFLLFLLTVLAALLRIYFSDERRLQRYAGKIEQSLQHREEEAQGFISKLSLDPAIQPAAELLGEPWGLAPFNIAWYSGDSLVFSLNNRYLPLDILPEKHASSYFLREADSSLFVGKWAAEDRIIWLPLWERFGLESSFLKDGFTGLPDIPDAVRPFAQAPGALVRSPDGEPLAYLRSEGPIQDPLERGIMFWLFVGIGLAATYLLNQAAGFLSRRFSPWLGILFLLVVMVGMRLLLNPLLASHPVDPSILQVPILNQSLGGLLLNTFFLLWLMLFFHRNMEDLRFPSLPTAGAILLSAVHYLSILLGMLLIAQTIRNLVLHSDLNLYLSNIFSIDAGSALAILAMALLFLAFFLFSHRMGRVIVSMGLSPVRRMLAFGLSLAAVIPFYYWTHNSFPLEQFLLGAIAYVVMLDLFSEEESPNLSWLILWLGIFSGLTALLLSGYHLEKGNSIQQDLARRLALEWKEDQGEETMRAGKFESLFPLTAIPEKPDAEGMEYAIYRQGILVDGSPGGNFPLDETGLAVSPKAGELVNTRAPGRIEWTYRSEQGLTAIVSREVEGVMGPISLFSLLFALFVVIMPLLAFFNYWFDFLPPTLDFVQLRRPTLSNRIQLSVISFLLLAFIGIGYFSYLNFRQNADYNQEVQVKQKIDALMGEIGAWLQTQDTLPATPRLSDQLLGFGRFHDMDLLVYDSDGKILASTFSPRLHRELAGSRMNSVPRYWLSKGSRSLDLQEERLGNLQYRTAYLPVRKGAGAPLAFIGMPFVIQPSLWQEEISGFISTLISVYAFMLIFVGAFAIYIAGSITRPISELGESLRKLELGKNEPLSYNRQDELGALIEEYNRTLGKLEDSTRKLAQSERESAWREMAKQVAHEIKNPLTPMRLSIQHMQYALLLQPEKVNHLVDQVSKTILEQIDSLNEIATAFSNFAKMPQAENSTFSINELLANVHGLFRNEQPEFELSLSLPEENILVFADKNQLMRVFNNLYKNAIQAIPEGRQGNIRTRLFLREGEVVVQVSDNGSGIPEATRDKVFVPNFTTKSSGSGLGLALSKNIVETAGGKIYFETAPEQGTDFFVELPPAPTGNS
ncbi:MAG: HAMP domain-containing protein [Saprospirales bacterium]|nr:HAMP domain-containing protein [Saprospirales bacterium]